VNQPSQYVGLEVNARRKSLDEAEVAVALAFPDAYTVGISHLGGQVLYQMLNDMPNVACDRTYCPRPDAEAVMRECDIPLFGWESRSPLGEFDVIGFSLPYEICATNVLTMLDRAGVPLRAQDRRDEHPLIVGGDALADSPAMEKSPCGRWWSWWPAPRRAGRRARKCWPRPPAPSPACTCPTSTAPATTTPADTAAWSRWPPTCRPPSSERPSANLPARP
jgi:hypothetical protein